MTVLVAC